MIENKHSSWWCGFFLARWNNHFKWLHTKIITWLHSIKVWLRIPRISNGFLLVWYNQTSTSKEGGEHRKKTKYIWQPFMLTNISSNQWNTSIRWSSSTSDICWDSHSYSGTVIDIHWPEKDQYLLAWFAFEIHWENWIRKCYSSKHQAYELRFRILAIILMMINMHPRLFVIDSWRSDWC